MRVARYARYSTEKQNELSSDVQLAHCREDIAKLGWIETLCFTDQAQSAATLHRPGMQALIAAAKPGQVDIIYSEAFSVISIKTRDGLRHRFHLGKNPGGLAYGSRTKIEHDGNGERIRGLVEIDSVQAAVVVGILGDYAAGRSPDSIAKQLNQRVFRHREAASATSNPVRSRQCPAWHRNSQ